MKFRDKLVKGKIKTNYKNAILDVEFEDGSINSVFYYNYDDKDDLCTPGAEIWASYDENSDRVIKYEAQLVRNSGGLIFINQSYNEEIFLDAFKKGFISELEDYTSIRKIYNNEEVKCANFEFSNEKNEKLYLYVASIYRKEGRYVVFPSNINLLEMNVLDEFRKLRSQGNETAVFFIIPRSDILEVKFIWSGEPIAAAKIFDEAKNGLKFYCYGCNVSVNGVEIDRKMDIKY